MAGNADNRLVSPAQGPRADTARAALVRTPLFWAVALGVLVRVIPVALAPFPLGDGGLFSVMATDLRGNGFLPPEFSSYNGVPFAYPPLSIYLLALWPGDPQLAERILPVVISVALIPATWLLARSLAGRVAADAAALAIALIPSSWALLGGDIPRGLWLLLAVLSTWLLVESLQSGSRRLAALAGLLAGLSCITHPNALPIAGATMLLVWARYGLPKRRWDVIGISGAVALALAGAWLLSVSLRYGPEVIATAAGSHEVSPLAVRLMTRGLTDASVDLFTAGALVGVFLTLAARDWFMATWLIVLVLIPGSETRVLSVPIAILAGVTWARLLAPGMNVLTGASVRRLGFVLLGVAFVAALASPFSTRPLHALSEADRQAMEWVRATTASEAVFAVVTPPDDTAAEWFPALARRTSITTYQGQEWAEPGAFAAHLQAARDLRGCTSLACASRPGVDYLFLSRGCCPELQATVADDRRVYDEDGVTVVRLSR